MRDTKLASSGAGLPRIWWWRSSSSSRCSSSRASRSAGVTVEKNGSRPASSASSCSSPAAERVERGHAELLVRRLDQRLEALPHLGGRGGRERQREDRLGRHPLLDEPGEAPRQRAGLSGARPRHHEQRAAGMRDGRELSAVEAVEGIRHANLGYAAQGMFRAASPKSRLLRSRDRPPPPRARLRVLRRGRAQGHRAGGDRADRGARDPAGLGGGLGLSLSAWPHPGDRRRRRRSQAVPLPRLLARAPRPREVRVDGGVRTVAASPAATGRARHPQRGGDPRASAGLCRSPARRWVLPHRLGGLRRGERDIRPGDDAEASRDRGRRRDRLRLRGQGGPAPRAVDRGPDGGRDRGRAEAPPRRRRRAAGLQARRPLGRREVPGHQRLRQGGHGRRTSAPRTSAPGTRRSGPRSRWRSRAARRRDPRPRARGQRRRR